jgi:hypothetical protein
MNDALINQARASKAAEDLLKAAKAQPVGYTYLCNTSQAALFTVHASTCKDIARDAWRCAETPDGIYATLEDLGYSIAGGFGGYAMPLGGGDPGDAPDNLEHALTWCKFQACVRKAGLAVKA